MRTNTLMSVGAGLLLVALGDAAHGQMFGPRPLGQPLSRRPGAGSLETMQESAGTLRGTERFLRVNRRPEDFVGPNLRNLDHYVGMIQARTRGAIPPTTQGVRRRVDRSESMNPPAPLPARGTLYYPRLEVDFNSPAVDTTALSQRAMETLARSSELSGASRIAVYVEGRTAILLGEVPSARDRELAELMLSFEPGISEIQNELHLNPNAAETEDSLAALRRQRTPPKAWTVLPETTNSAEPAQPPASHQASD